MSQEVRINPCSYFVELVQNRGMSFYEELLTLGQHLHERERLALYKFLIKTKKDSYRSDAVRLLNSKKLMSAIANGEILYSLKNDVISYSARKNGISEFQDDLRVLKLSSISRFRIKKISKFFAQTEVEVIWNYPLQGKNLQKEGSYCILFYPYFDLKYFSNGKSRIRGLFNKLRINDVDLRKKLRAS